jgi:phytoene synthase
MPEFDRPAPDGARSDALQRPLPPGSLRHLAVLFAGRSAQPLLTALYALEAELRRIADSDSHEASHARLQWWRGELDRLAEGRPTHPLAATLQRLDAVRGSDRGLLQEMLTAAELDLARFTYHDWPQLDCYCFRACGALQTLIATALASGRPVSEAERDFARRLGAAIRQTEMLQDLRHDLVRGRLYAPLDVLESLGIDPQELGREPAGSRTQQFLEEWRDRLACELRGLPGLLDTADRRSAQRHGLVLAALHLRQLERFERSRAASAPRIDIEGLVRLWTAWRTALRYA